MSNSKWVIFIKIICTWKGCIFKKISFSFNEVFVSRKVQNRDNSWIALKIHFFKIILNSKEIMRWLLNFDLIRHNCGSASCRSWNNSASSTYLSCLTFDIRWWNTSVHRFFLKIIRCTIPIFKVTSVGLNFQSLWFFYRRIQFDYYRVSFRDPYVAKLQYSALNPSKDFSVGWIEFYSDSTCRWLVWCHCQYSVISTILFVFVSSNKDF